MFDPRQPFSTADALAAGISRRGLQSDQFQQLFRGCYVAADVTATTVVRARAAIDVLGAGEFASHHTAATLTEGVVPASSRLHLGAMGERRARRPGIRGHRYVRRAKLVQVSGLLVTAPVQTFVDLAEDLDLVDLVVLGDSFVHRRRATPDQLVQAAYETRAPWIVGAREAVQLVRAGAESPRETRLRLLMHFAGLPAPSINPVVAVPGTGQQRRIDLAYAGSKLAIEFDGKHHFYGGERQWRSDILRREELERQGWRFVVIVGSDLFADPGRVLERIVDAMRLQGMAVPRIDARWRVYFRPPREAV